MTGLNESITLSFMLVGHTKFTPDSCFGLLKQRFRRTHVQCLNDIVQVVEQSASVNKARLVGNEAGEVFVPTYDWLSYFVERFRKLSGIKKYHQFLFSSSKPGEVICKEYSDSPGETVKLLKNQWKPIATDLPPVLQPSGLSADRQWYLYDKIRPFCGLGFKDITCPLPEVPRSNRTPDITPVVSPVSSPTRGGSQQISTTASDKSHTTQERTESSPPAKRARICTNCGRPGHNRRTCNQRV